MVARATSLSCGVSAISAFCWLTTQIPLHNQLPSRCHSHKASYSNLFRKLVAMATLLSTCGPPSSTWFLGHIRAHNPNGISIGSALFAQMTVECPYTLQWYTLSPKNCPFPWGIWTPSNLHGSAPRQCAHMGGHIGVTWRILLNRPLRRQCGLLSNYFDHLLLWSSWLSSSLSWLLYCAGAGKAKLLPYVFSSVFTGFNNFLRNWLMVKSSYPCSLWLHHLWSILSINEGKLQNLQFSAA